VATGLLNHGIVVVVAMDSYIQKLSVVCNSVIPCTLHVLNALRAVQYTKDQLRQMCWVRFSGVNQLQDIISKGREVLGR
jgi:hypothetical protein